MELRKIFNLNFTNKIPLYLKSWYNIWLVQKESQKDDSHM